MNEPPQIKSPRRLNSHNRLSNCLWGYISHHRKHKQTSTQRSTFFSAAPLSHLDSGAAGCQTCPDTRPDLPLGHPAPAESLQPVLPRSSGPGRLQSLSQGDATQNLHAFLLSLLPAYPGKPEGGGGYPEPEPFPLGPNCSSQGSHPEGPKE